MKKESWIMNGQTFQRINNESIEIKIRNYRKRHKIYLSTYLHAYSELSNKHSTHLILLKRKFHLQKFKDPTPLFFTYLEKWGNAPTQGLFAPPRLLENSEDVVLTQLRKKRYRFSNFFPNVSKSQHFFPIWILIVPIH